MREDNLAVGSLGDITLLVNTQDAKTEYFIGEDFSAENLIVEAEKNSNRETVTEYTVDYSNFNKNTAGIYLIEVQYTNVIVGYYVKVKNVEGVELNIVNTKTTYYVGENFSSDGLIVNKVINNVPSPVSDFTVDSSNFTSQVGVYTIVVEYDGVVLNYNVIVKEYENLELSLANVKTTYYVGEDFVSSGLVVNKVIGGSKTPLTNFEIDSSEFNKAQAGKYTIIVTYDNVSLSYDVEVKVRPVFEIDTTETPKMFVEGQAFTYEGLKAYYEVDGERFQVEGFEVDSSNFNSAEEGTGQIRVCYKGLEQSYQVEVVTLENLLSNCEENVEQIKAIEQVFLNNFAIYNQDVNYSKLSINEKWTTESWAYETGVSNYYVSYEDDGIQAEYYQGTKVFQSLEFLLSSISDSITIIPESVESVEAYYNDLYLNIKLNFGDNIETIIVIKDNNIVSIENYTFGVSYGKSIFYTEELDAPEQPKGLTIKDVPEITIGGIKDIYAVGEQLNKDNIKVLADGELASDYEYSISVEFDSSVVGQNLIEVNYKGILYAYFDVEVAQPELVLDTVNAKLEFYVGQPFEFGGLVVKYVLGEQETETEDFYINAKDYNADELGTYQIKVMYNGVISTYEVEVVEPPIVDEIIESMLENGGNIKGAVQTGMGISDTPTYATEEFAYTVYETESFTTQQWITSESAKYKVVYTDTSKGVEYIEQVDRGGTTPASQVVSFIISEFYTNVTPTNLSCGVQEGLIVITYTISGSDYYNDYQITMKADANNNLVYFEAGVAGMGSLVMELSLEELDVPEIPEGVDWTPYDSEVFADVDFENSTVTYIVGGEFDISNIQVVLLKSGEEENEVVGIARQWEVGLLNDGGLNTDVIGQYHITLSYKGVANFVVPIDVVDANFSNETIANIQANFADIKSGRGTSANPGEGDYLISQEMMYNETTTEEYTKKTWLYSGGAKYVIEYVDTSVPTEYLIKEGAGGFMTPEQTAEFMFEFAVNSVDRQNEVVSVVDGVVIVTYSFDNSADAERVEEICYNVTIKFDCNYHLQQIIIIVTSGGQSTEMNYEFSVDASEYEVPELPTGVTWVPVTNE